MPADDLVPEPMSTITHAITIEATPAQIWPWLAQLGAGRGGWYSWDRIDNGGHPSADRILEEYQRIEPGDIMPAVPGAKDIFVVATVEPPRDLVLTMPGEGHTKMSWEHLVEPVDGHRSRLIVRSRVARDWNEGASSERRSFIDYVFGWMARFTGPASMAFGALGHRIMEARHLRRIKARAERGSPRAGR